MENETTAATPVPSAEAQEGGQPYLATPRPWFSHNLTVYALVDDPTWFKDGKIQQVNRFWALVSGGGPFAAPDAELRANAALIARAVNLHDDLVEALREVVETAGIAPNCDPDSIETENDLRNCPDPRCAEYGCMDLKARQWIALLAKAVPATVVADEGTMLKTDETNNNR